MMITLEGVLILLAGYITQPHNLPKSAHNPEVVWFKSHLCNQKKKTNPIGLQNKR